MSAPSRITMSALEAKALSEIELAIHAGAARALRTRAAVQRQMAVEGTSSAGEKYPGVVIQTGEAAIAGRLANAFELLADEIESEAVR
jgi:hypothetical protein